MGNMFDAGAAKRAERSAEIQEKQLKQQRQEEEKRAAEAEDVAARRRNIALKGGSRGSLLATSETGVKPRATKLGG